MLLLSSANRCERDSLARLADGLALGRRVRQLDVLVSAKAKRDLGRRPGAGRDGPATAILTWSLHSLPFVISSPRTPCQPSTVGQPPPR